MHWPCGRLPPDGRLHILTLCRQRNDTRNSTDAPHYQVSNTNPSPGMLQRKMQQPHSAHLLRTALIALALTSALQLTAASLTVTPDTAAVGFGGTIVIDVLSNDAADPSSLRIKTQQFDGASVFRSVAVVQCGEQAHDCVEFGAPAARTISGILETYRQVGRRNVSGIACTNNSNKRSGTEIVGVPTCNAHFPVDWRALDGVDACMRTATTYALWSRGGAQNSQCKGMVATCCDVILSYGWCCTVFCCCSRSLAGSTSQNLWPIRP
jgi:hypothetical protein